MQESVQSRKEKRKSSKFYSKRNPFDRILLKLPTGELVIDEKMVSSLNAENKNNKINY